MRVMTCQREGLILLGMYDFSLSSGSGKDGDNWEGFIVLYFDDTLYIGRGLRLLHSVVAFEGGFWFSHAGEKSIATIYLRPCKRFHHA